MTNHKKTKAQFPQGPPRGRSSRSSRGSTVTLPDSGEQGPIDVPPPPSSELRRTRPPRGRRTPAASRLPKSLGSPLPSNAPGWMRRAQRMIAALELAMADGGADETTVAAIERAYAAFELGSSDRQIAAVARLVERAYTAIHEVPRSRLEAAFKDAAGVIHQHMPAHLVRHTSYEAIVAVVRDLYGEADEWQAVVRGTCRILGWSGAAHAHAAQAIRVAVQAQRR